MSAKVWRRDWLAEHFVEGNRAKQGFETFREAQDEADRRNTSDGEKRPFMPYKCGYCEAFHVGHSNPRRRRKR